MHKALVVGSALSLSLFCLPAPRLNAADYIVNVFPMGYSPAYLEIAPGDNVFWINQDDFPHTVTSEDGAWTRGVLIDYQDQFGLTFPGIGTYNYFCEIDGFTGTIVVKDAGPPPPNDQCNSATAMEEGTLYSANTAGATSTGDPIASCATLDKGIWYTFTAAADGTIRISTCGSGFDTVLAVYTGFCGSLSPVACNDDNGPSCSGITASVAFSGTARTTYRILAGGYGGASGNLRITATNSVVVSTWQEKQVSFDIGPSIARPSTNLVHIVDTTNDRLLTLDTATGAFVSSIRLYGKLAFSSLMCFSLDGQLLYVPLNTSNRLQVISLATLTTADLVPLTVSPTSVAAASDGALYTAVNGRITKLDPTTGQNVGAHPWTWNYYRPLLKANASGTRLYIMELGLSGGGAMIDEYAVMPSALPTYVMNHYHSKANDKDFVIAEDIGWLYSTSGGVYGIGAWDMNTHTYRFWPYDSAYGAAVAMVPNDSFVYGASGDPYEPRIRRFDRLTGAVSATFDINADGRGTGSVQDRSLQVTPNGRIFYARETRKLGLIGATALTTNAPGTAEIIDGGTNRTVFAGEVFTLSAIAPAASGADTYSWSKIEGPGEVTFSAADSLTTTAQLAAPGNYTLEIVRSSGTWLSRDRVYVTAIPVRFDQYGMNVDGGFRMRLRSGPGSFQIRASSNLVHWELLTNVSSGGEITIVDENRNRLPRRFYRAQLITN